MVLIIGFPNTSYTVDIKIWAPPFLVITFLTLECMMMPSLPLQYLHVPGCRPSFLPLLGQQLLSHSVCLSVMPVWLCVAQKWLCIYMIKFQEHCWVTNQYRMYPQVHNLQINVARSKWEHCVLKLYLLRIVFFTQLFLLRV